MTGLSANPSDTGGGELTSLEQLIRLGEKKPPKLSALELDHLSFHVVGISAVQEALRHRPFQYVSHQELSRYVTVDAFNRMVECSLLASLKNANAEFYAKIRTKEQRVRKFCYDFLSGSAIGYRPFQARQFYIWFWDEAVYRAVVSTLEDSGVTRSVFSVFCAASLADLKSLDHISDDLRVEVEQGMRCLRLQLTIYQQINAELG